ncbi:unnamed protein product [Pleuronectes platessa]|uniref:Secreted protein n=1 Tax=Pleuronectes platessa TaxID=8262 RepID=A0A9N7VT48_PLEPL|nr:unnamed protein product [Pleuronectes platessa]
MNAAVLLLLLEYSLFLRRCSLTLTQPACPQTESQRGATIPTPRPRTQLVFAPHPAEAGEIKVVVTLRRRFFLFFIFFFSRGIQTWEEDHNKVHP